VNLHFELLHRHHERSAFTCGVPALDDWFRTRATQDQRRRVAQVFVALDEHGITGFYSLSMFTLALDSIPADLARKLPRYDAIPAALIGRLARHTRVSGAEWDGYAQRWLLVSALLFLGSGILYAVRSRT